MRRARPGRSPSRPTRSGCRPPVLRWSGLEVMVPGRVWVALDPTNRQWVGERHVAVSFGRDYRDASPLRGTFKGSGGQGMKVRVLMKRRTVRPEKARAVA